MLGSQWLRTLAAAGISPLVMGDTEQPGRETGPAFEAGQVFPSMHKRFLGEIVSEAGIAVREMPEKMPHGGLMLPHQLAKRSGILVHQCPDDQIRIGHVKNGRSVAGRASNARSTIQIIAGRCR